MDAIQIRFHQAMMGTTRPPVPFLLGLKPQHMEIPRLGVESELQLPACATATTTWDPSHVCNLHYSSLQCWIPNPLSEARDQTCILVDTSQVRHS